MQTKRIHYIFAAISFLVAMATYATTMQPSIPFWDCGEFLGAAAQLGISHPPGMPTWTLIGHVLAWFVPLSDAAAKYNLLSAGCGALAAMFLYLTAVKVIKVWRGNPQSVSDVIVHYGGALIAALCFTYTDSVWFNSSEFIVFSPGLLFITVIIWLGMIWHEKWDEPGSEKILLLIFYLIGLSMGAHQMSMLAFFPVWVIVYYRRYPNMTVGKFIEMMLTGSVGFLFIFLVVLTGIVGWLGGVKQGTLTWIALLSSIGFVLYYWKNNNALARLILTGAGLVFLGFSTYTLVMVRGEQAPAMDQHHPTTFALMSEYIGRAQYGEAREFPRRNDDPSSKEDPLHRNTWDETKYSSDGDFFWKYQVNHMYVRYLLWNFIGRAKDVQDSDWTWSHTAGIPFLIGAFGVYWHFRRDPKRALAMLAGFLIMGILTTLYQNQQDAQPRERDYFYVGAFWIYAMWVGIGVTGIMEMLRARFAKKQDLPLQSAGPLDRDVLDKEGEKVPMLRGEGPAGMLAGVLALAVILIPLNQCIGLVGMATGESFHQAAKWGEYSRRHNNVPLEYAYNILQSCDQDAIIFTAGDNDTFPLWAIQDVYGVRTDVRIVNLSLGNMGWYIRQLKDQHTWGSKTVNLPSFTEEDLALNDEAFERKLSGVAPASMVTVNVNAAAMAKFTGIAQPSSFIWKFTSDHKAENGQYVYYVADQLVKDIVVNNINDRPIYFSIAMPPSYWVGLDQHSVFEGLVARIVPTEHPAPSAAQLNGDINEPVYTQLAYRLTPKIETKPYRAMMMESYRDPESNRSGLDEQYGTSTYIELYGRLANYCLAHNRPADAHRALDTMMARMPANLVDWDFGELQFVSQIYAATGDEKAAHKYVVYAAKKVSAAMPDEAAGGDQNTILQNQFRKGDLFISAEMFDSARTVFSALRAETEGGNQLFVDFRLAQIDEKIIEKSGDKKKAFIKLNEMIAKFSQLAQMGAGAEINAVTQQRDKLGAELGIIDTNLKSGGDTNGIKIISKTMAPAPPPPNK